MPDLRTTGILQLRGAYQDFVDFTSFLLNNERFTWTILTNNLRVSALQTIFESVTLSKNVEFLGELESFASLLNSANTVS